MRSGTVLALMLAACGFEVAPSNGVPPPDGAGPDPTIDAPSGGCVDVDQDQICDSADDWLCGTKPAAPGQQVQVLGRTVWLAPTPSNLANVTFNGGDPVLQTTAGASIAIHFGWGIKTACPGGALAPAGGGTQNCRAQIEYGLGNGSRLGCLVDGDVRDNQVAVGTDQVTTMAPSAPGLYELRAKLGFTDNSCGAQTTWFGGAQPDATQTFGYICVP